MRSLLLAALAGLALFASQAPAADLVIRADELHVGDGTTLHDVAVVVDAGRVIAIEPSSRVREGESVERRARWLLPGLVAAEIVAEDAWDALAVDPTREPAAHAQSARAAEWLAKGVTSLAITPGSRRLVSGRGGLSRVTERGLEAVVPEGAVFATLAPHALDPPLLFEPTLRPNVDRPLPPAAPQRPFTPMAAVAELRRLVSASPDFADVAARRVPLRIHADRAEDVRRAIELQRELGFDLVLEGGLEAWKLADELAAARALVVLEMPDPSAAQGLSRDDELRRDAAGVLDAAGVAVALARGGSQRPSDPLMLAAAAVRAGLPESKAIAAVTGLAARAIGADGYSIVREGSIADLVAFDSAPLSVHASPAFVVSRGSLVTTRGATDRDDDDEPPLALRAGRVLGAKGLLADGVVLVRSGRVVSVGASGALPADAVVRDFGPDAWLAPGFVDAFGWLGLEPGASPSGGSRVRAIDAVEPRHPSIARALRSGVTTALVVPGTRGALLGSAAVIGTGEPARARAREPEVGGSEPRPQAPDVVAADAGFVFFVDEGPSDQGPRGPRLKALKELVQKAKGYADARAKAEKKDKPDKDRKEADSDGGSVGRDALGARKKSSEKKDDMDPALEPLRALFDGRARAWIRAGRRDTMLEAVDALKGAGVQPVLAGGEEADVVAGDLARRGVTIVLSPATSREEEGRRISVAAALRAAAVPVALGSFGWGGSDLLPLAACAAVRDGLAPEDALAALTSTAAASAGIADAGRLEAGVRADVVAWSGDPLEPSSRVLAVVARGRLVETTSSHGSAQ